MTSKLNIREKVKHILVYLTLLVAFIILRILVQLDTTDALICTALFGLLCYYVCDVLCQLHSTESCQVVNVVCNGEAIANASLLYNTRAKEVSSLGQEKEIPASINSSLSDAAINQSVERENALLELEERKEREEQIEILYAYAIHYIGRFLTAEQRATLHSNIINFVSSEHPELTAVTCAKIGNLKLYDCLHLCHAIGYHSIVKKGGLDIAYFASALFPHYCKGYNERTLAAKLTCSDYPTQIPVADKHEPLADYRVSSQVNIG